MSKIQFWSVILLSDVFLVYDQEWSCSVTLFVHVDFRLINIMISLPASMNLAGENLSILHPGTSFLLFIVMFYYCFIIKPSFWVDNNFCVQMEGRVSSGEHQAAWALPCFATRSETGTEGLFSLTHVKKERQGGSSTFCYMVQI